MWDRKRQLIWLAGGLLIGNFVAYSDSHDEDGTFVPRFFIFMESLVLMIIATLVLHLFTQNEIVQRGGCQN